MTIYVTSRCDIDTEMGWFSSGLIFPAQPLSDGFRLNLLPASDRDHTIAVSAAEVYPAQAPTRAAQLDRRGIDDAAQQR